MTNVKRQAARNGRLPFDPGFIIVLAIALVAIWPFVSRAGLPQGTDAELHIFRLHELTLLIQGGEWYPRWAPNFYHGYGYPIFNYYAPLTYYLGLPVTLWAAFDAVLGVKFVFVLGLLLAAIGMYGFVRDNWGRTAGFVAAAVYLYAPYVQYVDPHARGVLAESFSLGLFPVALWALDRVRRGGGPWAWSAAVLTVAGVILSHNLMGLLFFGVFFAWAGWGLVAANLRLGGKWGVARSGRVFAALLLGVGVAAFFWLPVYLERDAVNLNTLIGEGDNYDFRTHFLSLRELLAPSLLLDWGATEPAFRFNLGVAQWLLGGVGVALLLTRRMKARAHAAFFALALVVLLFLMLPVSTPLWEAIPLLPFFQFPWRLLGAAAALLAILAGAATAVLLDWAPDRRLRAVLPALLVALPLLLALPLSQPAPWPDFGEVNTLRMSLIEHEGRWLGTTSTSDYLPATVEMTPERKGSVVAGYYEGQPVDRINRATLPEDAVVETERIRPLHMRYLVDAPRKMRLRLFLFDFPGWQVTIDGDPVETELGRPEGFIVVPVPAGEHVVDVRFGTTTARTVASGITFVSVGLMLLGVFLWPGRGNYEVGMINDEGRFRQRDVAVLWSVLGVTAVFILLLEPMGWLHYNSSDFEAQPAQVDIFADFGEQIALIGYDTSVEETAAAGQTIQLTLYWQAQAELDINYQAFVHLLRPDGSLVTQSHKLNPGDFPTRRWPTDKYVRDIHYFQIPADVAPGTYTVATGLWVQNEGWRLPLLDAQGAQIGDSVTLFTIQVR